MNKDWWIFRGSNAPHDEIEGRLPEAPPWRQFSSEARTKRGAEYQASEEEVELVNAALYLRRPLLITGKPGTGKTTLAHAVAHELGLGQVLLWPITTRTTLKDGLYRYDAIGRLQEAQPQAEAGARENKTSEIGRYVRLGPLGTALLPSRRPRVLLIDEIDKSDIDLPNDLLHVFEEGEFEIPELSRLPAENERVEVMTHDGGRVMVERGRVRCEAFPLILLTSNGEREFPPAFLRRCLRLEIPLPDEAKLAEIVKARLQLDDDAYQKVRPLVADFLKRRDKGREELATDQLLNAVYLSLRGIDPLSRDREQLLDAVLKPLGA